MTTFKFFKEEQLENLVTFYGKEFTTYKDLQDVDAIIKVTGYFKDKARSLRLMKMALSYIFHVLDDKGKQIYLTVFVPKDFINANQFLKKIRGKYGWI